MITHVSKKRMGIYTLVSCCVVFLFLLLPDTGLAQTTGSTANVDDIDLVKCGGNTPGEEMCTIEDFFALLVRVMQWGFRLGVAFATLMFAYAGLILMSSFGKPEKISKAKSMFLRAAIGIIIMFVSYSAIWFVLTSLGVQQSFYQFF